MAKNTWTEPSDFKPLAYYNSERDLIYVLTGDYVVTRVTVNDTLDMLGANYPKDEEDKYVGFIIKSAKRFCIKNRLPYRGDIDLLNFVDKILLIDPCPISFQDEIYRILILAPSSVQIPEKPPRMH